MVIFFDDPLSANPTDQSLIFAIVLVLNQPTETIKVFNESYIVDNFSIFMKVLTLLFCSFVVIASKDYIKINFKLSSIDELIVLYDNKGHLVDSVGYKLSVMENSYSRNIPFKKIEETTIIWENNSDLTIGYHNSSKYDFSKVHKFVKWQHFSYKESECKFFSWFS